ncbi:sugar phosphate isomerase/epimerase family protein [Sporosarcina jiandibaonis]|uniref:sugar phosphate isomerase/epimerase family protein n=1 Tax=Sporosarcina jiandibaonis TaxID=2715535 RepID=UPI001557A93D|nr:sugar phosphate isomerase/epimerase [Sporosarcina jiandibaonis]
MNISVSMYSLASTIKEENWSIIDFIDYASTIPVDGVELLDMYWTDNNKVEAGQVIRTLDSLDLKVSAYDISNNFVKETSEERDAEVKKVLDGIEMAKILGTDIVRVFCGDLKGELTFEDGASWIIEGLKTCAEAAEKAHVYLAIENHGLLAGRSEQVVEILKEVNSPYVKSTFDTGNFLLVHEKPTEAFDQLKNEIVHVHFKDFREKNVADSFKGFRSTEGVELIGVIPGDGEVDLAYIVDGLRENNYDGWLSIEYEGFEDAKLANEEAVSRLRNLLK